MSVLLGYGNGSFADQRTYSTGSVPSSLALGDFNNDHRVDITVANSGTNNVGISIGYGNNSFENQVVYPTDVYPLSVAVGYGNGLFANQVTYSIGSDSQPYSVAVGDFNSDTLLDIIVANHGSNNVSVLLGYGNGTFADQKVFWLGYESFPFSVVVGDFNEDGKLDFVAANEGTDDLKIRLNNC